MDEEQREKDQSGKPAREEGGGGDDPGDRSPPPLPAGYSPLSSPSPLLGTFDALWGVLALHRLLGEVGYLVYDRDRVVMFLAADEAAVFLDQLARALLALVPFGVRAGLEERFDRIDQAIAAYTPARPNSAGTIGDANADEPTGQPQDTNVTEAKETLYVFLVVLARSVRQIADLVEAGALAQGVQATVLIYGLTSKLSEGFLFLKVQGDRSYVQWLQNQVEGIIDLVAVSLKPL